MANMAAEKELCRLMDAYGDGLMGSCYLLLRDWHQAQDVVQETFLKAWKALCRDALRRETERAWLFRVAVNACRDVQRSRWFRLVDRTHPVEELPIPVLPALEDGLLSDVQKLPPRLREVIVLHYWNGMPPEDIARVLHIDRATVYRRLARARKQLRITLEGGGDL